MASMPQTNQTRIADLKKRYAGSITVKGTAEDAVRSAQRVGELMTEWNPIGSRKSDVRAILGEPTSETKNAIDYRFDTGWAGTLWRFMLEGDLISGVQRIPLE